MSVIVGTGIDVVDVRRFADIIARRPGFLDRILTSEEQVLADGTARPIHSLAARFAAKEAVAKALGAPAGLHFHDCQVKTGNNGQPHLDFSGTVMAAAQAIGAHRWHVSLSHDGDIALAYVIMESS